MYLYIGILVVIVIITVIVLIILTLLPKKCNKETIRELKLRIDLAVRTLKANIYKVQEDIIDTNPFVLLSIHPFYRDVLQLPFFVDRNPCYTRATIHEVIKDTYGNNLENATSLHTRLGDDPYHYVIIDINNAFDYYDKYKNSGLAPLLA